MPKVANKLEVYFSTLPIPRIDNKKHCVCTYCKECLCDFCNKWTKINTYSIKETTNWDHKYILLYWFQAGMVLKHIQELGDMYREVCFQFRHPNTKYSESHIIVKEISCHSRYFIYFLMLLYNLLCMSAINAMWELRFSMLLIYIVKIFFSKEHPINLLCPSVCRSCYIR